MNIQEAIKIVDFLESGCSALDLDSQEALEMAKTALEKQLPKKPKIEWNHVKGNHYKAVKCCPTCRHRAEEAYCVICGQALDWSMESEVE